MSRNLPLSRDERRQQILDAARRVFARRGYHVASIDDVVKEAEVARGTFYNYFPSKRAVFAVVLEALFEAVASAPEPIRVDGDDIPSQVRANLVRMYRALAEHQDLTRILLAEAVGLDSEADEDLGRFYERALERVERALLAGQSLGLVRAGDARAMASCLLGVIKEPVFQAMLRREPLPVEAVAEEAFALVWTGVLAAR
ncbi:TetR/AcrR family transcriptional regulator [Myxococcota bacterium]|nr:TetR/AcrR family transcriptional regulator [Myxococcota bacterium]